MPRRKVITEPLVANEEENVVEQTAPEVDAVPAPTPIAPVEIKPAKKKREMTAARAESLRKANEARMRKKIESEIRQQQQMQQRQEKEMEDRIVRVLDKYSAKLKFNQPETVAPKPQKVHFKQQPKRVHESESEDDEEEESEDEVPVKRQQPIDKAEMMYRMIFNR